MTTNEFLEIVSVAAKLKTTMRHCTTADNRQESVADHSWRIALMAMLLSGVEEFQEADFNKVVRMCLIHDLGEAFTGDIPAFQKTDADAKTEEELLFKWVAALPQPLSEEWLALFHEMQAQETTEAKLYKALDKIEAIISHNESDIATWLPLEYDLQFTYGKENMQFSPWLMQLRKEVDAVSQKLIENAKRENKSE